MKQQAKNCYILTYNVSLEYDKSYISRIYILSFFFFRSAYSFYMILFPMQLYNEVCISIHIVECKISEKLLSKWSFKFWTNEMNAQTLLIDISYNWSYFFTKSILIYIVWINWLFRQNWLLELTDLRAMYFCFLLDKIVIK